MSTDFQHLPWEDAADLSARLTALPIFQRFAPDSDTSEVLKRFFVLKRSQVAPGKPSLSVELRDRLKKADEHFATLGPEERRKLDGSMRALRRRVQRLECDTCALKSGHVCGGEDEDRDDAQLQAPGLCIRLLHELFGDVRNRYGEMIDRWAYDGDSAHRADLDCYLSTRAQPESAYDRAGPDWKICGSTRFTDSATGRESRVKLSIGIDELDWPSLCATFWILVHEYICHSQQGRPDAKPRKACEPSCAFFEGWMDELAIRLVTADLAAMLFPPSSSTFVRNHAPELFAAANQYRSNRYDWGPNERRRRIAEQWEFGVRALGAIDRFLQSFDIDQSRGGLERSIIPLCRLSFRLLAHAPTAAQAARIVAGLFAAPRAARLSAADARLHHLLTAPITNLSNFINELDRITTLSDM